MATHARRSAIQLRFGENDRVVVTPENEDRFALTMDEAVKACRAWESHQRFERQFRILIDVLKEWVQRHHDRVSQAHVTIRDGGLLFLVVMRKSHHDETLDESLTELDIEIANDPDLDLIRLSVLAIPNASEDNIASFL